MNIPEYYEDISLRLAEVLDASGLDDDLRWFRINTWLQIEELERITLRKAAGTDITMYCFGGQAEATTTPELKSDIDKFVCNPANAVLQDLQFWVPRPDETFLMVADESTPPGYVKLQLVQRDVPTTVNNYQDADIRLDTKGRSVLCNISAYTKTSIAHSRHGPANKCYGEGTSIDYVLGFSSHFWPDQAFKWLSTARKTYNWPTRRLIDAIKKTGVLFAPVGHKLSPERYLEWRLSFSLVEKLLMWQFNPVQYKCYVMLKFIKNAFINVDMREDVLTSYHCKTCMFYLIENTPASLWHPYNLLLCIDLCLRQLLYWAECATCPNYFIPDENMFLGKIGGSVKGKIASILRDLLRQRGRYITKIPYENIGENVVRACQSCRTKHDSSNLNALLATLSHLGCELERLCISSVQRNMNGLNFIKSLLGQRHGVVNIVRSLICSIIGSNLASQSREQEIHNQERLIMAYEFLLWGCSSDVASGNLKLATYYLVQGNLDALETVLTYLDATFTHTVYEIGELRMNKSTVEKIIGKNLSITKLAQQCLALPVFYCPSDIHIIPTVLIFEMFRSTGSDPRLDRNVANWIPMVAVKARLYLYFLQYQCFHQQERVAQKLIALKNLIWISKHEFQELIDGLGYTTNVSRKHTFLTDISIYLGKVTNALNLLAYCLKQDGKPIYAFKVLCKSMKLKNHHNAAKWQIAFFINPAVRI